MKLFELWSSFLNVNLYSGAIISLILNTILINLIIFRSPKSIGMYKYLMIYIAVFEIFYSIFDVIAAPTILSHRAAFIVFRDFKHSMFGREHGFLLILIYCSFYGFSIAILAVHFIYRYSTLDIQFRKTFLSGNKVYALFLIPIIYGVWWGSVVYIFCQPSKSTDAYLRNVLLDSYDIRVETISYMAMMFWNQKNEPQIKTFGAAACMCCMLGSSLACVLYFGIRCYTKLSRVLATSELTSCVSKSLQRQLFQALVFQTMIPFLLMYIPVGFLYSFPMLNMESMVATSFVTATIAMYPATDPLPTMFIVKNYRRTLLCRTCRS